MIQHIIFDLDKVFSISFTFLFFIYFFKKFSNETLMVFVAVSTAIWYSSQKDK